LSFEYRKSIRTAKAPNEPLGCCRHEFSMFGNEPFNRVYKYRRAVECSAVALDDTNNEKDTNFLAYLFDLSERWSRKLDCSLVIS
jgi:hypothetical protein